MSKKKSRTKWELTKDKKYLDALSSDPKAAEFLKEFEDKFHNAHNDKETDKLPPRSETQKKIDYHRAYASRNDVINCPTTSIDDEEKK